MINIALKTEYSFRKCFLPMKDIHKYVVDGVVGVADCDNTYSHVPLEKQAKEHGFKPIYGVRLRVSRESNAKKQTSQIYHVFLAKDNDGLIALYNLVSRAYENFYYFPRLKWSDLSNLHPGIIHLGPMYDNFFGHVDDREIYQLVAGASKRGKDVYYNFENKAGDMRVVPQDGFEEIANMCNVTLPTAPMIKYHGTMSLFHEATRGAAKLGIDLDDPVYGDRLTYELGLIADKGFDDYFKIVSSIVNQAKKKMLVGPGRGSSGGSLLCYLMGITAIDPIKYDLLFERFIDVNRSDFPDIDTDYPCVHRKDVLKQISKDYGEANVRGISNILTYKAKSAINEVAMTLKIPFAETEELKSSMIERSGGDARAALCVMDTFTDLEIGKKFIEKYPKMQIASKLEGHATTSGTHAAGIIVSDIPLENYCGVNPRDNIIMLDGKMAESIGLLKIDCLGLRTLSVLMECAKLAGFNFNKFYRMTYDDPAVFKILEDRRYSGIFQFDGQALGMVTSQMGCESFDDMIAITALARPGSLNSGGTAMYIDRRTGRKPPEYFGPIYEEITKRTYGVVVFQEQTMEILRKIGKMSWQDVNILRRAMSKSLGDEFFDKYRTEFINGAVENGNTEEDASDIWTAVASMGSYGFNKSHAVAYSMISYWSAFCKAHYPIEFTAANLNHSKDEADAIKILRDFVSNENGEYIPIDPDRSDIHWSISDNVLIGGLTNIVGFGPKKAKEAIAMRDGKKPMTPGIFKKLSDPKTPYDIIFPADHYFGFLYKDPASYGLDRPPSYIKDVVHPGEYTIIGCVRDRDLRSRNDTQAVIKRGGKLVEENIYFLNLQLEDDTDIIKCSIPPFLFDELDGQTIAESAIVGETWYLIQGELRGNWRSIGIKNIVNLNELFKVKTND